MKSEKTSDGKKFVEEFLNITPKKRRKIKIKELSSKLN